MSIRYLLENNPLLYRPARPESGREARERFLIIFSPILEKLLKTIALHDSKMIYDDPMHQRISVPGCPELFTPGCI